MGRPIQLTIEGANLVILSDHISQLEVGKDIDHLELSQSLMHFIEKQVAENPELALKTYSNRRRVLERPKHESRTPELSRTHALKPMT